MRYETVSALLTKTAQLTVPAAAVDVQPTGISQSTPSPLPSRIEDPATATPLVISASPSGGQAAGRPCDLAHPGRPLDVTIPDDSRFYPGETFSKTWRLVNIGSCSWAEDYGVVWFSGADMGVGHVQPLNARVAPGQTLDVTVDMVAPLVPGSYQSNWKVRNSDGVLFGIGPNGDSPFWVRIVVIPVDTPTATPPLPTPTQTPAIFASGSIEMLLAETVNLDTGEKNQGEADDLTFNLSEENRNLLAPVNGARVAMYGVTIPNLNDCFMAVLNDAPLVMEEMIPGSYLCYRTGAGLPGWILVQGIDLTNNWLNLDYLTWGMP